MEPELPRNQVRLNLVSYLQLHHENHIISRQVTDTAKNHADVNPAPPQTGRTPVSEQRSEILRIFLHGYVPLQFFGMENPQIQNNMKRSTLANGPFTANY